LRNRGSCSMYGRIFAVAEKSLSSTPGGRRPALVSAQLIVAIASCLRLFWDCMRVAASRTFWTAGSSRPIRMGVTARMTSSWKRENAERLGRVLMARPPSGQDRLDDVAVHIGQAEVTAVVAVGQLRVLQAEQAQDGGVQVVYRHAVDGR